MKRGMTLDEEHLQDLVDRCQRGIDRLREMEADTVENSTESIRLRGKADGVRVVQSWIEGELRSRSASPPPGFSWEQEAS